jgi:hypothetical protein
MSRSSSFLTLAIVETRRLYEALDEIRRQCGENGESGPARDGRWAAETARKALDKYDRTLAEITTKAVME